MSDQPMYEFKLEEKTMPYTFEPHERIEHLLYCIEKLNAILHNCDSRYEYLYSEQIPVLVSALVDALKAGSASAESEG